MTQDDFGCLVIIGTKDIQKVALLLRFPFTETHKPQTVAHLYYSNRSVDPKQPDLLTLGWTSVFRSTRGCTSYMIQFVM